MAASLVACGGGGGSTGGGGVLPTPTPTATPAATLSCTSAGAAQSIALQSVQSRASASMVEPRRMPSRATSLRYVPGVLEVVRRASASRSALAVRSAQLASTDRAIDVVQVPYGKEDQVASQLRSSAGVVSVSRAVYRSALSTTASLTNDPYFRGFAGGATPPLYEAAAIPGQYDMHVICAANAWGYANTNSTGRTYTAAQGGSSTVPVAVIDTGADLAHPDLSGRVTYAESDLNGVTTSGLASMHDNDGHGTNVAGIIGAAANNNFGFVGVAFNAPLMIFKVFPDPPSGGCAPGSTNPQCQASSSDVALAINRAVTLGAKVINLSLGSSTMDPAEENSVAAAISAGVVVVAASGNESLATLDYPGADPGVIAVGASSIDDSNPLSIGEKVASYSNYNAANPNWGIVAPGGDPCCSGSDSDDLHWIENIYTSTASDSSSMCGTDHAGASNDCRVLIAGTSQATPHVAGAAALLLSVGAAPGNVKTILCSTANGISSSHAGCGRLNVYRAIAQVVGDPSP